MSTNLECPIEPGGYRIVVKVLQLQETTAGGIFIPDEARERREGAGDKGVIVAIGKNAWKSFDDGEPWAELGQVVVLKRYQGVNFTYKDDKYVILNDEELLGSLKPGIEASEIDFGGGLQNG